MLQWQQCKQNAPDAVLFFRLGDFYEAFYEDAVLISKELDITLTKRQEVPMAGVPFHSSDSYIDRLVAKGYRVAIAEQMEDPRDVKGIVKREIVRIITPGTLVHSALLPEKSNNFLACVTQVNSCFGLGILDLTTADFRAMEFEDVKALADELCRLAPKEILSSGKWQKNYPGILDDLRQMFNPCFNFKEEWHFEHQNACELLCRHFHVHSLDGFGLKGMIAAINAAGAILNYVESELNLSITHIKSIQTEHIWQYMLLDRATQKHLELTETLHEGKKESTLLALLDRTSTPMGGRMLKQWLIHPLLSVEEIRKRQEGIATFLASWHSTSDLSRALNEVRDLERLIMRIETGYATPRDLAGLRLSLEQIPIVAHLISPINTPIIQDNLQHLADVSSITAKISAALVDSPPLRLSDGNIFKSSFHPKLEELRTLKENSQTWMAHYQTSLKESTQIKTLKVGYTKAFGFYIEVSRGQADKIPVTFQRRQTLINAERFITPELKEYEYKVLHAEEQIASLETELFHALRQEIAAEAGKIRHIAQAIAVIDCLLALSKVAKQYNYVQPVIDESDLFHVQDGRHPVIEASLRGETFVPNDVLLNASQRLLLLTGPNMAGKSTFIRQVALIAIMAQMGSFIPAKSAHLGIIDKVFSRIGASDDLSRGQSTFMVEMTETANILHNATPRSLVILDEIGRGTSTYDGISIAWAVAEYLLTHHQRRAKTLFATHYWELTALEQQIPGALNFNVAVHESDRGIVFLRKILKGGTDKSYGIHVAKLAGLPKEVLHRAQEMLATLEKNSGRSAPSLTKPLKEIQLSLFLTSPDDQKKEALLQELQKIDPNHLTPLEALQKIAEWKGRLSS